MDNRQLLKQKADRLTEGEIAEVLEYITIIESLREQTIKPDPFDKVILKLLSEAVKRAPQSAQRIHRDRTTVRL